MNIFIESSYQSILRQVVDDRKHLDGQFNFQAIAEATRIPKSYISKVTTHKAHFSADQLYVICDYLGFSERQKSYMALLLEFERSTIKKRRESIQNEIDKLREQALDTKVHIKATSTALGEQGLRDYYSDPLNQLVHMCLSISRYQINPQKLVEDLSITPADLRGIIDNLEALGVIEQEHSKIKTIIKNIHLPRSSPAYKPWRNQLKLMCLERLNRRGLKQDYSFSVMFSATESVREKIHADFLEFLKRTEVAVQNSKQENTYQLNFDLFPWTVKF